MIGKMFKNNSGFRYKWFVPADIDAYFGVLFDGFSKVIAITVVMIAGFGIPADIVIGRMMPAMGIAVCIGNFYYAYEAFKLAYKEERQDVTAHPFGPEISTWFWLVVAAVYFDSGDGMLAWKIGMIGAVISGVCEALFAFIGKYIEKYTPSAALLGGAAAVGLVWMAVIGFGYVFEKPILALLPLFIVALSYLGKIRLPFGIPAGLLGIVIGAGVAWATGMMDAAKLAESFSTLGFYRPTFAFAEIFDGSQQVMQYLPVIIPMGFFNSLWTLQALESGKAAGDNYPVKPLMMVDGLTSAISGLLGNPNPTTVYYGHPAWKSVGGRAGYSILLGITYLIIGLFGFTSVLTALIPMEPIWMIMALVGIMMTAQPFEVGDRKHHIAVVIAMIPMIAELILLNISGVMNEVGVDLASIDPASLVNSGVTLNGLSAFSTGSILISIIYASLFVFIVDRSYLRAANFSLLAAAFSMVGFIHSPVVQFATPLGVQFGIIYGVAAAMFYALHLNRDRLSYIPDVEELAENARMDQSEGYSA